MITATELKIQITQAKEDLEILRQEGSKRSASSKAKRLKFLIDCLSYVESVSAQSIVEQRNLLMPKYRAACERVNMDMGGKMLDPKNKELKKIYDQSCKRHGADRMKKQLHALNFILK